jgi:hypothetical protein
MVGSSRGGKAGFVRVNGQGDTLESGGGKVNGPGIAVNEDSRIRAGGGQEVEIAGGVGAKLTGHGCNLGDSKLRVYTGVTHKTMPDIPEN